MKSRDDCESKAHEIQLETKGAMSCQDEKQALSDVAIDSKLSPEGTGAPCRLWIIVCLGLLLLGIGYLNFVMDPVQIVVDSKIQIRNGTQAFEMWKKPPVPVFLKVFIFNVTNREAFLAGKEKLRVAEVGPYYYREVLENTNVTFNSNNSMTYVPTRKQFFLPEMSNRNPATDMVIVPNIALLGAVSSLHNASFMTNLALSSLTSYLHSQPFLELTAEEFMWGYDDPLVKLASNLVPSWITFNKLGVLSRMFDDGQNAVTISLGTGQTPRLGQTSQFQIDTFNGSPELTHWKNKDGRENHCQKVRGATEGVIFPRHMKPNVTYWVYRKAFCRTLPIQFSHESISEEGFPIFVYKLPDNVFDTPETNPYNECYCHRKVAPCLPAGLTDLTPCYYGIPAAVSFPHFYKGDPKLVSAIDGIAPDPEKHRCIVELQPTLGIALKVHSRLQTNIVVHQTKYNSRVSPFNGMVIPLFWSDLYFEDMPEDLARMMWLAIFVAPAAAHALVIVPVVSGVILLLVAIGRCIRSRRKEPQRYDFLRITPLPTENKLTDSDQIVLPVPATFLNSQQQPSSGCVR